MFELSDAPDGLLGGGQAPREVSAESPNRRLSTNALDQQLHAAPGAAWGAIAPGTYIEWGPAVTNAVTLRE